MYGQTCLRSSDLALSSHMKCRSCERREHRLPLLFNIANNNAVAPNHMDQVTGAGLEKTSVQ